MKAFTLTTLALAVAGARASVTLASSPLPTAANRYIIEVDSLSALGRRAPRAAHEAVYAHLDARGVKYSISHEWDEPGVWSGASVTVEDAAGLAALTSTPGITAIRPVRIFPAPKPASARIAAASDPAAKDTESTHVITGVDKLHAEGFLGKGVKIGIIDTGTDYTHPFLGGGFGPGYKVAGGYDFVGDAFDGSNTPKPDNDPLDQCEGHGTHVAGIIGANPGNPYNISGVAYQASLYSYRVFGCSGGTPDEITISALMRGYKDQMDIITLSLGGVEGWTTSSSAVVASNIAKAGRIVTIAAGNDGQYGSWYASSPGTGLDVISVASLENTVITVQSATVSNVTHAPIVYNSLAPLPIPGTHPVYATSLDTSVADDACDPLPASTPDLSNYVVLIRRGTCAFTQKLGNAAAKGAQYFLIYNNVAGLSAISTGNYTAALISAEDGAYLVGQLKAGNHPALTFPQTGGATNIPNPTGGLISTFSSYGPTFDAYFKPAVAAPGGNILSTYPIKLGTWAVLSGTSMATPFMAGVSALLYQAKGHSTTTARLARDLFETTAQPVGVNTTAGSPLQTLTQAGSGLVDAYAALHATVKVWPGELLLNDTAHFKPQQQFQISNQGRTPKTFTLSHEPAGTALTVDGLLAAVGPVPLSSAAVDVALSAKTITLGPGGTATIRAFFGFPKDVPASSFPVYTGHIVVSAGTNESYRVSYLGIGASLKSKQVLDTSNEYAGIPLPAFLNSTGDVQLKPTNYTLKGDDVPTVLFRLVFGTPRLTMDLVPSTTTTVPTSGSYASVKTLGSVYNATFVPRNSEAATAEDNGYNQVAVDAFANGKAIPKGSYKVLLRALRVTGDAKNEADYESYLSPAFGVV